MSELRTRLTELPSFPEDMAALDGDSVPDDPDVLFARWLNAAIEAGGRQPHAMTLATTRTDGTPVGRTLIVKDVDERGYQFATHQTSRKGEELMTNPRASMIFFWRESGRQVRITGTVEALSDEESQQDWKRRPSYDGAPNPDWRLYALRPTEFEFMQARMDRNHTRVQYDREPGGSWSHGVVRTPAG